MIARIILLGALSVALQIYSVQAQDVPALDNQPPLPAEPAVPEPVVEEVFDTPPAVEVGNTEEIAVQEKEREPEPADKGTTFPSAAKSFRDAFPEMSSLFFSTWEHDLIIDARLGVTARPPEMPIEDMNSPAALEHGAQGARELSLSGIVYKSRNDWTIWLNGMRITPTGIPEQVMDIKVYKNYIEIEWLDSATNQIYPVRLRPHQRFNLDSRIFLPG